MDQGAGLHFYAIGVKIGLEVSVAGARICFFS
jgi:hypothetical protein